MTPYLLMHTYKPVGQVVPHLRLNMRIIWYLTWLSDHIISSFTNSLISVSLLVWLGSNVPSRQTGFLQIRWLGTLQGKLHIFIFGCTVCGHLFESVQPGPWQLWVREFFFFFLQHMTSSHGFVMTHCPITCTNLIKNTIWFSETNNINEYNLRLQKAVQKLHCN